MLRQLGAGAIPWAALALMLLSAPTRGGAVEAPQIRGAYFHHYHERNHLEDLKKHGVNALLVKFSRLTPDGDAKAVARLKQYAGWSRELGLRLFPIVNLMGGGPERAALQASSRRETSADGIVLRKTPCPLDERFWHEAVVRRGCLVAQLARDHAIHAFVVDPEMYGADHTVFDGGGCWCDGCWQEFFKGRGAGAAAPGGGAGTGAEFVAVSPNRFGIFSGSAKIFGVFASAFFAIWATGAGMITSSGLNSSRPPLPPTATLNSPVVSTLRMICPLPSANFNSRGYFPVSCCR